MQDRYSPVLGATAPASSRSTTATCPAKSVCAGRHTLPENPPVSLSQALFNWFRTSRKGRDGCRNRFPRLRFGLAPQHPSAVSPAFPGKVVFAPGTSVVLCSAILCTQTGLRLSRRGSPRKPDGPRTGDPAHHPEAGTPSASTVITSSLSSSPRANSPNRNGTDATSPSPQQPRRSYPWLACCFSRTRRPGRNAWPWR